MSTNNVNTLIAGMTSVACSGHTEHRLASMAGVQPANVNLATKVSNLSQIVDKVEHLDYQAPLEQYHWQIQGLSCAACVRRLESALGKVAGVVTASVNLATERAEVSTLAGVSEQQLLQAIEQSGYQVVSQPQAPEDSPAKLEQANPHSEQQQLKRLLIWAAIFSIPLFLLAMLPMLIPPLHHWLNARLSTQWQNVITLLLAVPVQFGVGWRFYRLGWASLTHKSPDMNSLVMLGTSAAFVYSLLVTLFPRWFELQNRHVYFEASAVVITLVLLGKYLEAVAKARSQQAMTALLNLQPQTARIEKKGALLEVPTTELQLGDIVVLRAGEALPADGQVVSGESYIDEAMLTGEPLPVRRSVGDNVTGGTINGAGALRVQVTAVGQNSALARIVRLVAEAQASKPPIQALADKVVAVFVPIVLVIAFITLLAWWLWGGQGALSQGLIHAVAVLIIACPCAMGLATPVSMMVASGRAAQMGLIFRSNAALEKLGKVHSMALDKTGTLTVGQPSVVQSWGGGDDPHQALDALALAAAAERYSEHPLARAVEDFAQKQGLELIAEVQNFVAHAGKGVSATVAGQHIAVGSPQWIAELYPAAINPIMAAPASSTPVLVAIDGVVRLGLAVADSLRPETTEAMAQLARQKIAIALISGDQTATATAIARQLGIEQVWAEMLPADKTQAISQLTSPVAFVGDGLNDAPALASADVGIAIGTGTQVAIESADVILLGNDLRGLSRAVALSRATLQNIRQNLFWAFGYNILLIPVAAGVLTTWEIFLSPVLAAAAMSLSSVLVLSNALRLRYFRG